MNICVVGVGYVGLVTGTCFAEFGLNVTCVDNDTSKIDMLRKGRVPIYEPGLEEMVVKNSREGRLNFTTDLHRGVDQALVIFIAVGTPQGDDGGADLTYVWEVARAIGRTMEDYKVVVTKSTVPVGTGHQLAQVIRESQTRPVEFDVVSNPEFLREGSAIEDFMRPNRVVIGTEDEQAEAILRDLYRPLYLIETPILSVRRRAAELVKYASNAFLAVKISYINEIADLCERLDVDVHDVARGMGLDRRIGAKFLHPGPGYGGSCFPKDTVALLGTAAERQASLRIVEAAVKVNEERPERMVERVREAVGGELAGRTIALLGLAFKPNTDDVRESPALKIAAQMIEHGARVRAFDPVAGDNARAAGFAGELCADEYAACEGADAMVLGTEWNQFRNLDMERVRDLLARPVVVDLRNVYEPERMRALGIRYRGVGR